MSADKARVVLDTNILISGLLFKGSLLRRVVTGAFDRHTVIFSGDTWDELAEVFQRPGFEKTLPLGARLQVLAAIAERIEVVSVRSIITDCHEDDKDNKFLAVALDGKADVLVSGDSDLTNLHPWRGIPIIGPAEFEKGFLE